MLRSNEPQIGPSTRSGAGGDGGGALPSEALPEGSLIPRATSTNELPPLREAIPNACVGEHFREGGALPLADQPDSSLTATNDASACLLLARVGRHSLR